MPRVRRTAFILFTSMLAVPAAGGCAYLFPSCATIPGCPTGQILCNNLTCSDLRSDPFNCGMCNNACGAGLACVPDGGSEGGGACGCALEGQTLVDGECLELSVDPDNCGAVGRACRLDQACFDGGCGCLSLPYLDGGSNECATDAGPICADLLNDPQNCGSCGHSCVGGCMLGDCDAGMVDGGEAGPDDAGDAGGLGDAGDGG
jgi:hypothetical protein